MPPRKRARPSAPASASSPSAAKTPTPDGATAPADSPTKDPLLDAWTDEEEAALFRGLMRYKPTGIHKHFRLLSLHHFLLTNGYIHPNAEHTRPAGIWKKLQSLYDLEALDEREDARQLSDLSLESQDGEGDEEEGQKEDDVYSEAENKIHREEFSLPEDDFGEMMWKARFADADEEAEGSPLALPDLNLADERPVRFTPSFSVEPSEAATPTARPGRGRPAGSRGRAKAAAPTGSTRRSARQAGSVAEEEQEEDEEDDEEDGEEEDDDVERSEEESEKSSTPATRSTRNTRGRGRGGARGRGRGRGRGK